MQEKLSKTDQFLYAKIDNESKDVRSRANGILNILESLSKKSFNSELQILIDHMKKIPTIEIIEMASLIEEAGVKLQKFQFEISTHPELIKIFGEDEITELLNEIQLFGTSCLELSKKAIEFEANLDS
jgi:hypothetical protein